MAGDPGSNAENDVLRREKRALEAELDRLRLALSASRQRAEQLKDESEAARQTHRGALAASEGRAAAAEIDMRAAWSRAAAIGTDLSRRIAEGQARLLASQAAATTLEQANAELTECRAAIALREADLRAVIESAIDCAIITTDATGLVLAWNSGAERLLGWEVDRALVMDLRAAFAREQQEASAFEADLGAALRGERIGREDWMRRPDGTQLWAAIEAMALRAAEAEEPAGVLWMIRDRTAAHAVEQALRISEDRLAAVLDQLPVAVGLSDRDGRWLLSNPHLRDIMGEHIPSRDGARTARWQAWDDQGQPLDPSHWPGARALRGETVRPGVEFLHTAADGRETWYRVSTGPFVDGSGAIAGAVCVIQDVDAERRARDALRTSEERFRIIVENARDYGIFVTDEKDVITDWMPHASAIFGWTREEAIGQPSAIIFTPDDRDAGVPEREFEEARRDGSAPDVRWHLRKDGSRVFIEGRVTALTDPDGRFRGVLKIGQDVTERKRAADRQALLSYEVDHRAKNVIALVQGMIRLTHAGTVEAFVEVLGGRLQALSRVHSLLARDRWDGADLRALIEAELRPFLTGTEGQRARMEGPRVLLPPDAVQPFAMALHELATNAVKHGALSAPTGSVAIAWDVLGADPHRVLRLRWVETGGPPVIGAPGKQGFGTTVMEGSVRHQLDGRLTLAWERTGLACTIEVPLVRGATSASAPDE